jgi:para-nitrobenzyl esterase
MPIKATIKNGVIEGNYNVTNGISTYFGIPVVNDGYLLDKTLLEIITFNLYNSVVALYLLDKTLPEIFRAGDQAQVPLLLGWNSAENLAPATKQIGARLAAEIEYAMGNLHLEKEFAWTPDDYKASKTMFDYFTNFGKKGDPNGEVLPVWSAAKAVDASPPVMVIDSESKEIKSKNDIRYQFYDRFYKNCN